MFIDDLSKKVWEYLLRQKDEVLSMFQHFVTLVETSKKVKYLCFDNGKEYMSKSFQDFCDLKQIKRELILPYNSPNNNVIERMSCTTQERVCSILSNAKLSSGFWAKVVAIVIHLINR